MSWSPAGNSGDNRTDGAEEQQPSLSLVYISSCLAGDNGENDSLTRDLPNNDSRACADNTHLGH